MRCYGFSIMRVVAVLAYLLLPEAESERILLYTVISPVAKPAEYAADSKANNRQMSLTT